MVDLLLPGHSGRLLFLGRRPSFEGLCFQQGRLQELWLPVRRWNSPRAGAALARARPAPVQRRTARREKPPPKRRRPDQTISASKTPVKLRYRPILLRPQPPAHRDFGETNGHELAVPDPAAGREDEGKPAALPIGTECSTGGRLGMRYADHEEPRKASAMTAATSVRFLRVHQLWGMAVAPVETTTQ